MAEGAWIFLSHSHRDFDQVSRLRNELEVRGHHPLMFFLKCLDDDSEIDDLIRREIRTRSWFILCDSAHSRASRWVDEERKIIAGLATHNSATVNLDDPLPAQLTAISTLTRQATVFLSYAQCDRSASLRIGDSLRREDFGVFSDLQIGPGAGWQEQITAALDDAVEQGAVLVLLSLESLASQWQRLEIAMALERAQPRTRGRNVVPIFLDDPGRVLASVPAGVHERLAALQGFDFSSGDSEETMAALKRWLRSYPWLSG